MEPHIHSEHQLKIGVMGSASGPQTQVAEARRKARELGKEIARRGHVFINGACPGLPHDALLGNVQEDGFSIGISPAFSLHEHAYEYKSPHENNVIIYTGMGFMERDIINIRSSDGIVIVGGGIGTLNELTIAYEEGRPIGVLTNSGGISDSIPFIIEKLCMRQIPPNIVFHDEPAALLDKLEDAIKRYPLPIHEDGRVIDKPEARRKFINGVCEAVDLGEAGSAG
ncbi:LOG family protein [Candidatus Peregrinibacteria bacterium]|nr:LOG family protein [Candidatus Peregrinibacteria bacterium]